MFDLGALGELLVILIAILVLFGPKEIPDLLRHAGRWAGRLRALSREMQHSIDAVIHQAEADDYKEKAERRFEKDIQETLKNKDNDA